MYKKDLYICVETCRRKTLQKVQLPLRPMCVTISCVKRDLYISEKRPVQICKKKPMYIPWYLSPEDPAKGAVAFTTNGSKANVFDDLVHESKETYT